MALQTGQDVAEDLAMEENTAAIWLPSYKLSFPHKLFSPSVVWSLGEKHKATNSVLQNAGIIFMNEFHTRSQYYLFLIEQGIQLLHHNCLKLACSPEVNTNLKSQTMITGVLKIHTRCMTSITNRTLECSTKTYFVTKRVSKDFLQYEGENEEVKYWTVTHTSLSDEHLSM